MVEILHLSSDSSGVSSTTTKQQNLDPVTTLSEPQFYFS